MKSLSRVRLFATPWTVAYQALLSMGFSRQEYWSGLPFLSPGDLPNPGIEPRSPELQTDTLLSEPPGIGVTSWPFGSPTSIPTLLSRCPASLSPAQARGHTARRRALRASESFSSRTLVAPEPVLPALPPPLPAPPEGRSRHFLNLVVARGWRWRRWRRQLGRGLREVATQAWTPGWTRRRPSGWDGTRWGVPWGRERPGEVRDPLSCGEWKCFLPAPPAPQGRAGPARRIGGGRKASSVWPVCGPFQVGPERLFRNQTCGPASQE